VGALVGCAVGWGGEGVPQSASRAFRMAWQLSLSVEGVGGVEGWVYFCICTTV